MNKLGLGVMLNLMAGNENTINTLNDFTGKIIRKIEIVDDRLKFSFVGGSQMVMYDDGQSCCERRYMHTDDDLSYFVDTPFLDAELRNGPDEDKGWEGVKESQFLIITTGKGQFTVVNYNEHNGYYGGFSVVAERIMLNN
jgi:hypothetical protein